MADGGGGSSGIATEAAARTADGATPAMYTGRSSCSYTPTPPPPIPPPPPTPAPLLPAVASFSLFHAAGDIIGVVVVDVFDATCPPYPPLSMAGASHWRNDACSALYHRSRSAVDDARRWYVRPYESMRKSVAAFAFALRFLPPYDSWYLPIRSVDVASLCACVHSVGEK
jgi:hypothetical protein